MRADYTPMEYDQQGQLWGSVMMKELTAIVVARGVVLGYESRLRSFYERP